MSERTKAADTTIVRAAIYPAIGVARVGNSENGFFLAPEVTDPLPGSPGVLSRLNRCAQAPGGAIPVYGLNAAGRRSPNSTLTMRRSAGPSTSPTRNPPGTSSRSRSTFRRPPRRRRLWLRNMTITDRAPGHRSGPRHITGRDPAAAGPHIRYRQVRGNAVYLGEFRTDAQGRLIVLGGRGKSASFNGAQSGYFRQ